MADLVTLLISLVGSAATSFVVAKYYGERWVETRRSRMEHSVRLKEGFFKPLLSKNGEHNNEYVKIEATYSRETGKFVPSNPETQRNWSSMRKQ